MIDNPKLEELIAAVKKAAHEKKTADEQFEATKARLPEDEQRADQAQQRYEKALADLSTQITAL